MSVRLCVSVSVRRSVCVFACVPLRMLRQPVFTVCVFVCTVCTSAPLQLVASERWQDGGASISTLTALSTRAHVCLYVNVPVYHFGDVPMCLCVSFCLCLSGWLAVRAHVLFIGLCVRVHVSVCLAPLFTYKPKLTDIHPGRQVGMQTPTSSDKKCARAWLHFASVCLHVSVSVCHYICPAFSLCV